MEKLMNKIKKSKFLYNIYTFFGNILINLISLFVKTDNNLILFVSYGGRHYNDSPAVIYEAMLLDNRFKNYKCIWAFRNPRKMVIPGNAKKIKINSLKYIIYALKSRCWITNVNVERGLKMKGKNTFYFHTTHGVLMKKGGNDVCDNSTFNTKFGYIYDCSCAQSEYEADVQVKMFGLKRSQIILSGYPKNDILVNINEEYIKSLKLKLNLPLNKKIILYAPTFREDKNLESVCPLHIKVWEENLSDKYILIYKGHPVANDISNLDDNSSFVYNFSKYSNVTDLMIVSDILISDYSGIIFDYSILNRPIFLYTYDYEEYVQKRGLYFDIRKELLGGSVSEIELINLIKNTPYEEAINLVSKLREKYVTFYGNATKICLDKIYNNIKVN